MRTIVPFSTRTAAPFREWTRTNSARWPARSLGRLGDVMRGGLARSKEPGQYPRRGGPERHGHGLPIVAGGGDGNDLGGSHRCFHSGKTLGRDPAWHLNLFDRGLGAAASTLPAAIEALATANRHSRLTSPRANGRPFVHQFSAGMHARMVLQRDRAGHLHPSAQDRLHAQDIGPGDPCIRRSFAIEIDHRFRASKAHRLGHRRVQQPVRATPPLSYAPVLGGRRARGLISPTPSARAKVFRMSGCNARLWQDPGKNPDMTVEIGKNRPHCGFLTIMQAQGRH